MKLEGVGSGLKLEGGRIRIAKTRGVVGSGSAKLEGVGSAFSSKTLENLRKIVDFLPISQKFRLRRFLAIF